jgi:hypothetical protein
MRRQLDLKPWTHSLSNTTDCLMGHQKAEGTLFDMSYATCEHLQCGIGTPIGPAGSCNIENIFDNDRHHVPVRYI